MQRAILPASLFASSSSLSKLHLLTDSDSTFLGLGISFGTDASYLQRYQLPWAGCQYSQSREFSTNT